MDILKADGITLALEVMISNMEVMNMFKDWQLGLMEEHGLMDTNEGLIGRVANVLNQSDSDVICTEEFRDACYTAGVDSDSFSQADLDSLQRKLR